jgi:hypothetical protein
MRLIFPMNNNVIEPIYINDIEPIYNNFSFTSYPLDKERTNLKKELDEKFGSGGGIVMDFVKGKINFNQYKMKCEIMGCLDYNVPLIQRIISYYDKLYSFQTYKYSINLGEEIKQYMLKLKTNITILNKYMIDNF